jgi:ABC-2 type transport system permease protein
MGSMWDIGRKQLEDTFSSRKFLAILGLFLALSMGSVYMGVDQYNQEMESFQSGDAYGSAPEKPSLTDVFSLMVGLNLPLAAGVLAILLSYDVISREREEGTIELLLSYPVYRDEVINGKFASGLFTVSLALLIAFIASSGLAIYLTGQLPTLEQLWRLMFVWQGSIVYMAFFFGLGTLFSTLFRSSWRSLIAGMLVLLFFLATPFLASMAANFVHPMDLDSGSTTTSSGGVAVEGRAVSGEVVVEHSSTGDRRDRRREIRQKRQNFQEQVSKISPSTSYQNFVSTMLGTSYESSSGLKPSIWEDLRSAFGYLVFLLSETMMVFTASYAVFMRQDL